MLDQVLEPLITCMLWFTAFIVASLSIWAIVPPAVYVAAEACRLQHPKSLSSWASPWWGAAGAQAAGRIAYWSKLRAWLGEAAESDRREAGAVHLANYA